MWYTHITSIGRRFNVKSMSDKKKSLVTLVFVPTRPMTPEVSLSTQTLTLNKSKNSLEDVSYLIRLVQCSVIP